MSIGKLILLRHGQSEWNAKNLFTGWVDVALSSQGEAEAKRAGELLKEKNLLPDVLHTSLLTKNANMYCLAFAINELGDIFLVGRLALSAVSENELDRIIGAVLQYSDSAFNPLLELGFSSAIRREWAWRLSRGESLSNLKAFEHLI